MVERKLDEMSKQIKDFIKSDKKDSFEEFLDTMFDKMDELEISFNRELSLKEHQNHQFFRKSLDLSIEKHIKNLQMEFSEAHLLIQTEDEQPELDGKDSSPTHFNIRQQKYQNIYLSKKECETEKRYLISIELLLDVKAIVSTHFADQYRENSINQKSNEHERPAKWLTTKDVCSFLGVTERTLYNYVKEGKLPVHQPSKKVRFFKESDLFKFIENSKQINYPKAS